MRFIGTQPIETARLYLRRLTIRDAEQAYYNWCSSEKVARYIMWGQHANVEVTKKLYAIWEREYQDFSTYRWIVELKETREVIGTIDIASKKYLPFGTCEIGYCYGERFWGKGYASEALQAVIGFLFEVCDADTIFAEYMRNNPGSGRVMEKAGMNFEGFARGRVLDKLGIRNDLGSYSITKKEYYDNR